MRFFGKGRKGIKGQDRYHYIYTDLQAGQEHQSAHQQLRRGFRERKSVCLQGDGGRIRGEKGAVDQKKAEHADAQTCADRGEPHPVAGEFSAHPADLRQSSAGLLQRGHLLCTV